MKGKMRFPFIQHDTLMSFASSHSFCQTGSFVEDQPALGCFPKIQCFFKFHYCLLIDLKAIKKHEHPKKDIVRGTTLLFEKSQAAFCSHP